MTTDEKPTTQLTLLEKDLWVETNEVVYLRDLPANDMLLSPPPSQTLIDSVREHGVLVPIAVVNGKNGWVVIDGRRRIKAARLAEGTTVPAVVVDAPGLSGASLAAHYHATRSANPISDLASIKILREALVQEGRLNVPEIVSEIAKATGLAIGTVKARLKLLTLDPVLIAGVQDGMISLSVLDRVARLPAERQARLVEHYAEEGKLTLADLKAEVSKGASQAVADFDWDQIDGVPGARPVVPIEAVEPVRRALVQYFENWSYEDDGTFVVSNGDGPRFTLTVVLS